MGTNTSRMANAQITNFERELLKVMEDKTNNYYQPQKLQWDRAPCFDAGLDIYEVI